MKQVTPPLVMNESDHKKLSSLVENIQSQTTELLEQELARATIVGNDQLPHHAVSMNSVVNFIDLDSQKEMTLTLVYPHEADMSQNRVSILAPIGSALIGLQVGQTIDWPLPNGNIKRLQVISVERSET